MVRATSRVDHEPVVVELVEEIPGRREHTCDPPPARRDDAVVLVGSRRGRWTDDVLLDLLRGELV